MELYTDYDKINDDIKQVREELENIVLPSKTTNLVEFIINNPQKTFKECCSTCGYKGTQSVIKTSKARKYLDLRRKLNELYDGQKTLLTKDEVITQLKSIAKNSESVDYQIKALALASKILGLEAPVKSEVDVKQVVINFEEDR